MSPAKSSPIVRRELFTLVLLTFAGVLLLPIAIYLVGSQIFGDYGGGGFADFYRDLHSEFRDRQIVVIFLIMSPYLVWQLLRATLYAFRRLGPANRRHSAETSPEN